MEAFQFEPYLIFLPNRLRIIFTQFRVSNTTLFRTMKQLGGSTFIKKYCTFCDRNEIGDEFNILFKYDTLKYQRDTKDVSFSA